MGNVELFGSSNFDVFHTDKITVVLVCSKSDYVRISKSPKRPDLLVVKANPLCEIVE